MMAGLLQWYQETTDVAPLAVDDVGYPANHTGPDRAGAAEEWWQRFNPNLHPRLRTTTVDGHPLEMD